MSTGMLLRPLSLMSAKPIGPSRAFDGEPDEVGVVAPWSCSVLRVHVMSPALEVVRLQVGREVVVPTLDRPRGSTPRSYEVSPPLRVRIGEALLVRVINRGRTSSYFEAQILCEIVGSPPPRPMPVLEERPSAVSVPPVRDSVVSGPAPYSVAGLTLSLVNALEMGDDDRVAHISAELLGVVRVEDYIDIRSMLRALARYASRSLSQ